MSSLNREISGPALFHHLKRDQLTLDQKLLTDHGRTARTLVKEGPLRLTLMGLAEGGDLPEHKTSGPVSIHVIEGSVTFSGSGREFPLGPGEVLMFAANVAHSAKSAEGCVFLLTVVHEERES
ncbi:MAG TPA: cupin domain-containing protein [Gemmatimonadaceae bacterium]|nr:cupin domain-containing protein [Gemmatimonadaceae bacterium]